MRPIDADVVIEKVMNYCKDDDGSCAEASADIRELLDEIENLPSVQPEPTDEQVAEYCKRRCLHIVTDDFFRAIQPEPHEGEWVYGEDSTADCVDGYRCSRCGFFVPWDYNHKLIDYINDYAYCPKCGAKMK